MKLETLSLDGDHATFLVGPLACVIWTGEILEYGVRATELVGERALRNSPRGVGLLGIIESTAVMPTPEARDLTVRVNERLIARGAVAVAAVCAEDGFRAAAVRGIVTSMSTVTGHSYPFKTFGRTDGACLWLGDHLRMAGIHCSVKELQDEVDGYRRALRAREFATIMEGAAR